MKKAYQFILVTIGISFALFFFITLGPLLIENPNVISAFKAGYVNPYSSGFATDAIACWFVLTAWVIYDYRKHKIQHGWVAVLLGLIPGVATGFAVYLLLRLKQKPE